MGGGAFAHASAQGEPTLNTPRLSPQEYTRLKVIYLGKLQDYFPESRVFCLKEAPEKADYGDMDICIALDERVDFIDMANYLGATGLIRHSSGHVQKYTLGVPKSDTASPPPVVVYKHAQGSGATRALLETRVTEEEYAQIDVDIIPSQLLDWHTFYSSYGDMAGLLGHIVHNLGFTVSDRGLWLRMKELDFSKTVQHVNVADEDGKMLLTYDPSLVMRFLGLSVERYETGFETLDELYEWLGECRLLSAEAIKTKRDNAHERNREQKRTVFSRFFYEWLPAHMDMNVEQDEQRKIDKILEELRQMYVELAIDFFSKQDEYTTKHNALVLTVNNAVAANLLKPLIAQHSGKEGKSLNEIVRAFRRCVGFQVTGQPVVLETPHSDTESQLHNFLVDHAFSLKDPESASEWVQEHWEELRALERQRSKASPGDNV